MQIERNELLVRIRQKEKEREDLYKRLWGEKKDLLENFSDEELKQVLDDLSLEVWNMEEDLNNLEDSKNE